MVINYEHQKFYTVEFEKLFEMLHSHLSSFGITSISLLESFFLLLRGPDQKIPGLNTGHFFVSNPNRPVSTSLSTRNRCFQAQRSIDQATSNSSSETLRMESSSPIDKGDLVDVSYGANSSSAEDGSSGNMDHHRQPDFLDVQRLVHIA